VITVVAVGIVEYARMRYVHGVDVPDVLAPLADGDPR